MRKIKGINKIMKVNKSWKPSDIAFISKLGLSMGNLELCCYSQQRNNSFECEWPDLNKAFFEISIIFLNVCNLKIEWGNTKIHQISGFDILDISKDGLENISYQIEDYENDTISFFCKEIMINSISKLHELSL